MSFASLSWLALPQILLALALVLVPLLNDRAGMRALRRHTSAPARIAAYRSSVVNGWVATALALLLGGGASLLVLPSTAADAPWLLGNSGTKATALAVLVALLISYLATMLYYGSTRATRARIAGAIRPMRFLLPVAPSERRWFAVASLTAGIGEEICYRGYLLGFLHGRIVSDFDLGLIAAWLVSSAAFGVGHLYQGLRGALSATAAGLVLGLLAILTGNLLLPMLVHALGDLGALWAYRPLQDDPEEAEPLVRGCNLEVSV